MKNLAVVGSGPAAFYAVQRLLSKIPVSVDIFERFPVPYGLARFGVAPDHPEVKNCQDRFREVAESPTVSFYGNVMVGRDIEVQTLLQNYNAVLFAYGAQRDRRLDIPGASHPAVRSARDFVAWYNGDPHFQDKWDLDGVENVSIIGNGNVALDMARILLRDPYSLSSTDITSNAVETLSRANIKKVNVVGRRGVLQSAFTNKELRELLTEPGVGFLQPNLDKINLKSLGRADRRKVQLLEKGSKTPLETASRSWSLEYLRSPIRFVPRSETRLERIDYCINTLEGPEDSPKSVPTPQVVSEKSDLVFLSIGYKGIPLEGLSEAGIDFDHSAGIISTQLGRVPGTNAFAAGWIKNGPQGVIVSTMMDGYAVGEEIAAYLAQDAADSKPGVGNRLNGHPVVTWQGWEKIDAEELSRGRALGKPREKLTSVKEMLEVALLM